MPPRALSPAYRTTQHSVAAQLAASLTGGGNGDAGNGDDGG